MKRAPAPKGKHSKECFSHFQYLRAELQSPAVQVRPQRQRCLIYLVSIDKENDITENICRLA